MTQPSEEQVRAWLKQSADEFVMFAQVSRGHGLEDDARRYEGTEHLYRAALALLDAGRKDRERLDWLEHQSEYGRVALDTNNPEFDNSEPKYTVYASAKGGRKFGDTLRAAIDQARDA